MNVREVIYNNLKDAIIKPNENLALEIIDLITNNFPAEFNQVDQNNKTFLFLAIENKLYKVAIKLLALAEESVSIISDTNTSLLHLPINDPSLLNKLLDMLNLIDKKAYLLTLKDDRGNIPLHKAASDLSLDSIKIFLEHYALLGNLKKITASTNKDGDTPLHLLLNNYLSSSNQQIDIISSVFLLMNHGINVAQANNKKETILSLLALLPSNHEKTIASFIRQSFSKLADQEKVTVLAYYKKEYVKNPYSHLLRTIYTSCAALINLTEGAIALIETNKDTLRNTYTKTLRVNENKLTNGLYLTTSDDAFFVLNASPYIINKLPIYLDLLEKTLLDNKEFEQLKELQTARRAAYNNNESIIHYDLTNIVRTNLTISIEQLNNDLLKLDKSSPAPKAVRLFAGLLLTILCTVQIGLESWLAYEASIHHGCDEDSYYNECIDSTKMNYELAAIIFGVAIPFLFLLEIFLIPIIAMRIERKTQARKEFLDSLHETLLPLRNSSYNSPRIEELLKQLDTINASLSSNLLLSLQKQNISQLITLLSSLREEINLIDLPEAKKQDTILNIQEAALDRKSKGKEPMWRLFRNKETNHNDDLEPDIEMGQSDEEQPLLTKRSSKS